MGGVYKKNRHINNLKTTPIIYYKMNHYAKSNVSNQELKLKVGSYVEVSIDDLTEFIKNEDDGAVIYGGVVVNVVYNNNTGNIRPPVEYIEVEVSIRKRADGITPIREPYIDMFELTDMTHLFVY